MEGFRDEYIPVDGYDWLPENMEETLKKEIVINDPYSKLIFKERFVEYGIKFEKRCNESH